MLSTGSGNTIQRVIRELLIVLTGQVAAATGSFFAVKVLTVRLSSEEYGLLGLALTGITLVQLCVGGPISQAALRYYSVAIDQGELGAYFSTIARMFFTSAVLLCAGALVVSAIAVVAGTQGAGLLLLSAGMAVLYGLGLTIDAVQASARNRRVVALHQTATQWLRPVIACCVLAAAGQSAFGAMVGYFCATVIVLVSQLGSIASLRPKNADPQAMPKMKCQMMSYALPFASWGLISWLQTASDRWLLEAFCGAKAVGVFTVYYQLGYYPMLLVAMAMSGYLSPILFQLAGDGTDRLRLDRATKLNWIHTATLLCLTLVITVVAWEFRQPIIRHMSTAEYLNLDFGLPWMVVGSGLYSISQALSLMFLVKSDSKKLVKMKIGTAVVGGVVNIVGVKMFGVPGAIGSCVLFGFISCCWILSIIAQDRRRECSATAKDTLKILYS